MLRRRAFLLCSSASTGSSNNNNQQQQSPPPITANTSGRRSPLPPIQSSIRDVNQPSIRGLGPDGKVVYLREQRLEDAIRAADEDDARNNNSTIMKSGEMPRPRPYSEYTGESVAKPSTVAAGTAPFKEKGSVMRPSSIPSSPQPEWMSNTERKWVTAPIEFGKSTVDTRREWFRVMHYNTLVDRFAVPDPVVINGRKFRNDDLWDQHILKIAQSSVEKHNLISSGKMTNEQQQQQKVLSPSPSSSSTSESNPQQQQQDEGKAVLDEVELSHYQGIIDKHRSMKEQEATSKFLRTDIKRNERVWDKKIKKGEKKPRGDPRPDAPWQTTPIANVEILDDEGARWHNRGARIAEEIVFYDPDILTVNEMNRIHFGDSMWRALRSQGYGSLYVSARSEEGRRRILRNPDKPIPYYGDIGNCVFFHKARFFPMYQPGADTNTSIPYLNLVGLRDRVTNLSIFLGVLQFTAGDDLEAIRAREAEARGVIKALHGLTIESDERQSNGVLLCGDLNNVYADEPCVNILRDKYRSAYDAIGGARWTSWYKRADNKNLPFGSSRHLEASYESRHMDARVSQHKEKKVEISDIMKKRATLGTRTTTAATTTTTTKEEQQESKNTEKIPQQQQPTKESPSAAEKMIVTASDADEEPKSKLFDQLMINPIDIDFPDSTDDIALRAREKMGVVKSTSDYVMYEDRTFSVLRVLDCPPDEAVLPRLSFDEEQQVIDAVESEFKIKLEKLKESGKLNPHLEAQMMKHKKFAVAEARHLAREFWRPGVELLPNDQFPSHHIPLIADVCWNRWSFDDPTDNNTWNTKY